jgi:hypothetical protein
MGRINGNHDPAREPGSPNTEKPRQDANSPAGPLTSRLGREEDGIRGKLGHGDCTGDVTRISGFQYQVAKILVKQPDQLIRVTSLSSQEFASEDGISRIATGCTAS